MKRRIHTAPNSERAAPHATTRCDGQSPHFGILRHAQEIARSAIMARRAIERRTSVRCAPRLLASRAPRSTSAIPATNRRYGMTLRGLVGTRATEKRPFVAGCNISRAWLSGYSAKRGVGQESFGPAAVNGRHAATPSATHPPPVTAQSPSCHQILPAGENGS